MNIGVVIVTYNVRGPVAEALSGIPETVPTVVVDNASTDGSAAAVREAFPWVTLLERDDNIGFGAAVNRGVAALPTHVDSVLLLNPDAVLPGAFFEQLSAWCVGDDVVGFRLVGVDGRFQLPLGLTPHLLQEAGRKVAQRALDRRSRWAERLLDRWLSRPRGAAWVAGTAMMVRRRAFESLGGFDERFFLYFEDIDLCLRAASSGLKVRYEPRITVTHLRGASGSGAKELVSSAYRDSQRLFWRLHGNAVDRVVMGFYLDWRYGT